MWSFSAAHNHRSSTAQCRGVAISRVAQLLLLLLPICCSCQNLKHQSHSCPWSSWYSSCQFQSCSNLLSLSCSCRHSASCSSPLYSTTFLAPSKLVHSHLQLLCCHTFWSSFVHAWGFTASFPASFQMLLGSRPALQFSPASWWPPRPKIKTNHQRQTDCKDRIYSSNENCPHGTDTKIFF